MKTKELINEATGEISRYVGPTFFKTPYNHDTDAESNRTGLHCLDKSKAQQHSKQECDINTIVDRFLKTGELPPVRVPPTYEDFSDVFDLQGALDLVKQANESFMGLNAKTRASFQNDPAKFVAYVDHCMETGDLGPLREMGLAIPEKTAQAPETARGAEPQTPSKTPSGTPDTPK